MNSLRVYSCVFVVQNGVVWAYFGTITDNSYSKDTKKNVFLAKNKEKHKKQTQFPQIGV